MTIEIQDRCSLYMCLHICCLHTCPYEISCNVNDMDEGYQDMGKEIKLYICVGFGGYEVKVIDSGDTLSMK